MVKILGAILLAAGVSACTYNPLANMAEGGVAGAAIGGAIGCVATAYAGCAPGAALGAAVGGGVGAVAGVASTPGALPPSR